MELQKKTVPRETFQLLEKLMNDKNLSQFNIAGGTALALYMGHRLSIDLDLFSQDSFDSKELENYLISKYSFRSDYKTDNTLKGSIDGVKIDCIKSSSELCKPIREIENIRLYSPEDIIAMKLLAIVDNGTRLKDFVDISFLSVHYTLNQMLDFAEEKFPNKNRVMFEKALAFQSDIIHEKIDLIGAEYQWKNITNRINKMIQHKNLNFNNYPVLNEPQQN